MDAPNPIDLFSSERSVGDAAQGRLHAMARLERGDDERTDQIENARGDVPYALTVRSARPNDLPSLIRPPEFVLLNEPMITARSYAPFRAAVAAMTPGRERPKFYVARSNGNLVGFAHFAQSGSDRRWIGVAMGAATGVYGAGPAWEALLRQTTVAAGLRGVKRLFAKAPSGLPFLDAFGLVGFTAYATETIFVSTQPIFGTPPASARRQESTDAWAVHQLYNAATPKQVQYAEALTSDRWSIAPERSGARVSAWTLEEGSLVIGSVRVTSLGGQHRLELLHHPDRPEAAKELVIIALARLRKAIKVDRISCAVRGYQAESATALEDCGFQPVMEQDLLIKYTTATARIPQIEGLSFPAELIERLPKRAPSFPIGASIGDQGR